MASEITSAEQYRRVRAVAAQRLSRGAPAAVIQALARAQGQPLTARDLAGETDYPQATVRDAALIQVAAGHAERTTFPGSKPTLVAWVVTPDGVQFAASLTARTGI